MHKGKLTPKSIALAQKPLTSGVPKLHSKFGIKLLSILVLAITVFIIATRGPNNSGILISGLNYTDRHISEFTVNGYSGMNISANGGGGSFVCCVSVPAHWREGLHVTIRWYDDEDHPDHYKERTVEIPKYGPLDFGFLAVHFYEDDSVRVLVTTKTEGYPGYPHPRPGGK